jgi:hypothetical protein
MRFFLTTIGAALLALAWSNPSQADTFTYTLGNGNPAIAGFPGPYGSVFVNLTSPTMATITFTSNVVGGNIYLFGGHDAVVVNVNATSWTLGSTITGTNAGTGFSPGPLSNGGSNNDSAFGRFNQTISSFDGFSHSSDTISFTLTDTSGTWASAANVLVANAGGSTVGAHIFVTPFPANAANGAIVTGDSGNGAATPEPSTLAIAGLGALGMLGYGLRRRRTK